MSKKVNFIEAINSHKEFKIANNDKGNLDGWMYVDEDEFLVWSKSKEVVKLSIYDVINYNYVIKENKIRITESQFDAIKNKHHNKYLSGAQFWHEFKKELGF